MIQEFRLLEIQKIVVYFLQELREKKLHKVNILYVWIVMILLVHKCVKYFIKPFNPTTTRGGGGVLDIIGFTSEITPKPSKGNCLINSPLGVYQQPELMDTVIFHWMIWNKVYHRNIVAQTIHFLDTHFQSIPKINMAEDALKFFILCLFSKNYYGINDILHFYFKNEKSITRDLNNLRRHKSAIQGFSQTISMLRKIQDLHPLAYQKASVIIERLSNHKRETLYSFWTTRARSAKNYIGNLNRAIKITRSPKKKIIAYRKICLYLVSFGFFKS